MISSAVHLKEVLVGQIAQPRHEGIAEQVTHSEDVLREAMVAGAFAEEAGCCDVSIRFHLPLDPPPRPVLHLGLADLERLTGSDGQLLNAPLDKGRHVHRPVVGKRVHDLLCAAKLAGDRPRLSVPLTRSLTPPTAGRSSPNSLHALSTPAPPNPSSRPPDRRRGVPSLW